MNIFTPLPDDEKDPYGLTNRLRKESAVTVRYRGRIEPVLTDPAQADETEDAPRVDVTRAEKVEIGKRLNVAHRRWMDARRDHADVGDAQHRRALAEAKAAFDEIAIIYVRSVVRDYLGDRECPEDWFHDAMVAFLTAIRENPDTRLQYARRHVELALDAAGKPREIERLTHFAEDGRVPNADALKLDDDESLLDLVAYGQSPACVPLLEAVEAPQPTPATETVERMSVSLGAAIGNVLKTLPRRHAEVLKHRFALFDYEPLTHEQIGVLYECSRNNIQRIEYQAIFRLRMAHRALLLREFLSPAALPASLFGDRRFWRD